MVLLMMKTGLELNAITRVNEEEFRFIRVWFQLDFVHLVLDGNKRVVKVLCGPEVFKTGYVEGVVDLRVIHIYV